jgi:hypothetical protein
MHCTHIPLGEGGNGYIFLQGGQCRTNSGNKGLIQGTNQLIIEVKILIYALKSFTINAKSFHAQQKPFDKGMGDLSNPSLPNCISTFWGIK